MIATTGQMLGGGASDRACTRPPGRTADSLWHECPPQGGNQPARQQSPKSGLLPDEHLEKAPVALLGQATPSAQVKPLLAMDGSAQFRKKGRGLARLALLQGARAKNGRLTFDARFGVSGSLLETADAASGLQGAGRGIPVAAVDPACEWSFGGAGRPDFALMEKEARWGQAAWQPAGGADERAELREAARLVRAHAYERDVREWAKRMKKG